MAVRGGSWSARGLAAVAATMALAAVLASSGGDGGAGVAAQGQPPASAPAASASCGAAFGTGDAQIALEAAGRTRTALVHVDPAIAGDRGVPVVIGFHGWTATAEEFAAWSDLSWLAGRDRFLAVFPQGFGNPSEWHFGNPTAYPDGETADDAFISSLIDRLDASGCVDPRRVFLIGHSQGGGMVAHLACRLGDRIAAIALVSAMYLEPPCVLPRALPVIAFHALDDETLPYGGGHVAGTPADYPHVLPAQDMAVDWAARDGSTRGARVETLDGGVVRFSWLDGAAPVVFYRLPTGGHGWPASPYRTTFDAGSTAWAFFIGAAPGPR